MVKPLPPIPADSQGQLLADSFYTNALGISKTYMVYLPPSYKSDTTRRYPVAYLLHGITANEHFWIDSLQINQVLDSLNRVKGDEMIVIMPDGDNSFYHTWVNPPSYQSCLARGRIDREPAQTFCVPNMRYDDYVAHDLVQHIDSLYRTIADKAHRGVMGYSMGGGGAVYLTLTRPTVFGAAASMSGGLLTLRNVGPPNAPVLATDTTAIANYLGVLWKDLSLTQQYGTDLTKWDAFDPMLIANSLPAASIAPLWLTVGVWDNQMLKNNQVFHAAMVRHGVVHTYIEQQGDHSAIFWRAHEGQAAAWLSSKIKQ